MKLIKKTTLALAGLVMAAAPAVAADKHSGIQVDTLGKHNALVRVDVPERYLMLPVQESCPDAAVHVIADGKFDRTIYVRMAKDSVDYYVPFDLDPYKGHKLVLNVVVPVDHNAHQKKSVEDKPDICWSTFQVTDKPDFTNIEKHRPLFHHTPEYGWMNDPNGMFYKDGVWHLYYQWNPYGSKWQNMTWGHSTSKDLINWEHQPTAIEPDGHGAIFSGSSAVDTDNSAGFGKDAVVAMFTSARESQMQSLAVSHDNGVTFHKYAGNPVLTLSSEARDPNFFWNPETKEWTLVLAHALEHEMLVFTSPDMKEWTLQSKFGKGLGSQGGVWECPDLFELPIEGTNKTKWVFLVNLNPGGPFGGSGTQYFVGDFDGKTFTPDTDAHGKVPTKWMDFGKDNYASVSWSDAPDNRRTLIGWMSNWEYADHVPTMQFRSANTLPRDMHLFEGADGQIYMASVPSPEMESMRGSLSAFAQNETATKHGLILPLPTANQGICEILADLDAVDGKNVTLTLSNAKGEKVVMVYNPHHETLSFNRKHSGEVKFDKHFSDVSEAQTFGKDGKLSLRIYVDTSSIEVFGNDGKFALTNLVFPEDPYTTLTISSASGKALVKDLKIYSLNPADSK